MPRVELETLTAEEATRVFVSFTLAEAQLVEDVLTAHDLTYAVTVEQIGSTLFGSPRRGAIFIVQASRARACATLLAQRGFDAGLLIDAEPPTETS